MRCFYECFDTFLSIKVGQFSALWVQGDSTYLEAVENSNVDLHQCLVFPKGGSLSGV